MSISNLDQHLQVTCWLFLSWLLVSLMSGAAIFYLRKNPLKQALTSKTRYHLEHRHYYPVWLACIWSMPVAAILGAAYIPQWFYMLQRFLYQADANTLLFPAYSFYPDALLFACTGLIIWSFVLKTILTCFFQKCDAACALFTTLFWQRIVSADPRTRLTYRHCLEKLDVVAWAKWQWHLLWRVFLVFWMIGGLWAVMELNHYIQLGTTQVNVNRFWDLNERQYPLSDISSIQVIPQTGSLSTPEVLMTFHDTLQWNLMRSNSRFGPHTTLSSDLKNWMDHANNTKVN